MAQQKKEGSTSNINKLEMFYSIYEEAFYILILFGHNYTLHLILLTYAMVSQYVCNHVAPKFIFLLLFLVAFYFFTTLPWFCSTSFNIHSLELLKSFTHILPLVLSSSVGIVGVSLLIMCSTNFNCLFLIFIRSFFVFILLLLQTS